MHFFRKISQDTEKFIFTKRYVYGIFIKVNPLRRYRETGKAYFGVCYIIYMCCRFVKLKRLAAAGRFFAEEAMEKYKATLMDEAAMTRALKRISHEILEKNNGCENLCIIGIKRRGTALAGIIADNIYNIENTVIQKGEIDITYYRDDLSPVSPDPVIMPCDIPFSIVGKHVILVDDVLYTGRTVRAAMDALMRFGRAATIQLAVLIDRGHRELPIRGDYVGKNVPTSKAEIIAVKLPPYDDISAVELYEYSV